MEWEAAARMEQRDKADQAGSTSSSATAAKRSMTASSRRNAISVLSS
jgi:hypothetical protein